MKTIKLHIAFSFFVSLFFLSVLHYAENRIYVDHQVIVEAEPEENQNSPDKLFLGNGFFDEDYIHLTENLFIYADRIPVGNFAYFPDTGVLPDLTFWNPPRISKS